MCIRDRNIDGYCNQYEIDLSKLKVLNLSEYTILHWLALLVTCLLYTSC